MTPADMTDDQLRVAVAERMGWKILWPKSWQNRHLSRPDGTCFRPADPRISLADLLPDFPADLNACHEMEETLNDEQKANYAMMLHEMHGTPLATFWHRVICSTARQRCIAFLDCFQQ